MYEFTGSKSSGNRHHALAEPGNLTPKEVYEAAKEYFEFWHPSAKEFYAGFEFHFERKSFNVAAFQLHQSAERA